MSEVSFVSWCLFIFLFFFHTHFHFPFLSFLPLSASIPKHFPLKSLSYEIKLCLLHPQNQNVQLEDFLTLHFPEKMTSENEDGRRCSSEDTVKHHLHKPSKASYTRAFLLSLANVDGDHTLPEGLLQLPISSVNEAPMDPILPFPDSKCVESASQPLHQISVQAGLLGNGARISALKIETSGHYALHKSNEPYRPPHQKNSDLLNDVTFGSSESHDHERVKQERKSESLELMRKQTLGQEVKNKCSEVREVNIDEDIAGFLKVDNGLVKENIDSGEHLVSPVLTNFSTLEFSTVHITPQFDCSHKQDIAQGAHTCEDLEQSRDDNCKSIMAKDEDGCYLGRFEHAISISFGKDLSGSDFQIKQGAKSDLSSDFDEKMDYSDELCLPDEDTLIAVDEHLCLPNEETWVRLVDYIVSPERNTVKVDSGSPGSTTDIAEKLVEYILKDEPSPPHPEDPIFLCCGHHQEGWDTCHHTLQTQQSYRCAQLSPVRGSSFCNVDYQLNCPSFWRKPMNSKTCLLHPINYSPPHAVSCHSLPSHSGVDHFPLQETPVPEIFSFFSSVPDSKEKQVTSTISPWLTKREA